MQSHYKKTQIATGLVFCLSTLVLLVCFPFLFLNNQSIPPTPQPTANPTLQPTIEPSIAPVDSPIKSTPTPLVIIVPAPSSAPKSASVLTADQTALLVSGVSAIASIGSAIGFISTLFLTWKKEKREEHAYLLAVEKEKREKEAHLLAIEKGEREKELFVIDKLKHGNDKSEISDVIRSKKKQKRD